MRKAYLFTGLAVLAAAVMYCDGGGNGGTGPTPGGGGGPGVWFTDNDSTAHKLSLAGAALCTAGGFV